MTNNILRMVLLPCCGIAELILLTVCWILALVAPRTSKPLIDWITKTLPSVDWYIGK
jgi:hypothetical protein